MIQINNFKIDIIKSKQKMNEVVKLISNQYLEQGYCDSHLDIQNFFQYNKNIIPLYVEEKNTIISTMTIALDHGMDSLPCEHVFADDIQLSRRENKQLVEITKFASLKNDEKVLRELFIVSFMIAQYLYKTNIVAMIEPHHLNFYTSRFNFESASDIKLDSKANNAPSLLINLSTYQTINSFLEKKSSGNIRTLSTLCCPETLPKIIRFIRLNAKLLRSIDNRILAS